MHHFCLVLYTTTWYVNIYPSYTSEQELDFDGNRNWKPNNGADTGAWRLSRSRRN